MEPTTMMGIGSLLSGGSKILGMFGGGKSGAQKQNEYYQNEMARMALDDAYRYDRAGGITHKIRMQVRDAKKAGLHPLFAMGGSANYSPQTFIPGQFESGSAARDAVSGGLDGIGAAMQAYGEGKQIKSEMDARKAVEALNAKRTEAEIGLLHAQTAVALKNATDSPTSSQTFGMETNKAPERPPLRMKFRNPDGTYTELYNPDAGLDEVSQFDYFMQGLRQFLMGPPKYNRDGSPKKRGDRGRIRGQSWFGD